VRWLKKVTQRIVDWKLLGVLYIVNSWATFKKRL